MKEKEVVVVVKIGTEFLSAIRDKAHCICALKNVSQDVRSMAQQVTITQISI